MPFIRVMKGAKSYNRSLLKQASINYVTEINYVIAEKIVSILTATNFRATGNHSMFRSPRVSSLLLF